jgi:hypothetical protein
MATFTVFSGIFMYAFVDVPVFVETVGFLAIFIEALLGAPQLLQNFKNKSTAGMRYSIRNKFDESFDFKCITLAKRW